MLYVNNLKKSFCTNDEALYKSTFIKTALYERENPTFLTEHVLNDI